MTLRTDPSGIPRLIGEDKSELVDLYDVNSQFGEVTNFPSGIWMLGGNDTVHGSLANDLVFGNDGEDSFRGDEGDDSLFGGRGKDFLQGNEGNNYLSGGQDADWIIDNGDDDILLGGRGNDILYSGYGNDTLIGGLGRDFLAGVVSSIGGNLPKWTGRNLYVLQPEPGVTDINQADLINHFRLGFDRIGLASGLTPNDVVLEELTNTTIFIQFDVPEDVKILMTPSELNPPPQVLSGTLIKLRNTGDFLGFVPGITPDRLQNSIISVQEL